MRRLLLLSLAASGTLGAVALMPHPAAAQQADRIIDIYGDDKCPSDNGQQIVVCHRHSETERYRIPKTLRDQEAAPQAVGNNGVAALNSTGSTGVQVNSCNSIGAGVAVGCTKQAADAWAAQKAADKKDQEGIP
jgi:hypothetical protein